MAHQYIYLSSIDSTNAFATKWLSKSKPSCNSCIYTYEQTAGRGQFGRKWESESGKNISCSIVIPFRDLFVKDQIALNMSIALRVRAYIAALSKESCFIKWPNDIYLKEKKIGGLLIQNVLTSKQISYCIIGVGLNINQTQFSSDIPNPISLKQVSKKTWNLLDLMHGLMKQLNIKTEDVVGNFNIIDQYNKHLYRIGKECLFRAEGKTFKASILEVDPKGHMVLQTIQGKKAFAFGDIRMII